MSRMIEISFQIDEGDLNEAVIRLDEILGGLDAEAMFDKEESAEPGLRALLDKLSSIQCRFPVEPGDEDDSE